MSTLAHHDNDSRAAARDHIRELFAEYGKEHCANCRSSVRHQLAAAMLDLLAAELDGVFPGHVDPVRTILRGTPEPGHGRAWLSTATSPSSTRRTTCST
jgi:hypothetical protein